MAEALHLLRSIHQVDTGRIEFFENTSFRNENAVIKLYEALMKILFVGTEFSDEIASKILNFSCMLRNNIILQQYYIEPNEFSNQPISVKL